MLRLRPGLVMVILSIGLLLGGCSINVELLQTPVAESATGQPSETPTEETPTTTLTESPEPTATLTESPTATRTPTSTETRRSASSGSSGSGAAPTPTSRPGATSTTPPTPTPSATQPPTAEQPVTPCPDAWFTDVPETGCPTGAAVASFTAVQQFEHGWMFWFENPGRYVILYESAATGEGHAFVTDPLTIYRDTSGEVTAPEGLYAPVSGFGLVWRGDVFENGQGYRDVLGWAIAPESGYDSLYQCRLGPTPNWTCYFSGPQGQLVGLSSVGTWFME